MLDIDGVKKAQEHWEQATLWDSLEKYGERKKDFKTLEGAYSVKRLYTPLDLAEREIDYVRDIGFPGEYPYTRGIEPTMYRRKLWDMSQYVGLGSATEMNQRLKYLRSQGLTGIAIALDLPTQIGYDSDNPNARKEVGKVGVAISSLEDVEGIFEGIPLNEFASIRCPAVCIAPIFMAFMIALCEKQGVNPGELMVAVQNDPLREIAARGTQIFPAKPSVRFATDVAEYCAKNLPTWRPFRIADYHYKQLGAPPVDSLAFAFCTLIEYLDNVLARGVGIDDVAPQVEWTYAIGTDFFDGIARFRAARKLWAKTMRERYGAQNPESMKMKNFAVGYGYQLTAQEPINNIIRVTVEALAFALSGPQTIALPSYDEAKGIPSPEAAKIALRTQQIIGYETGVADVVDPLGGSYYVESLTDEIEKQVLAIIKKVDDMGGAVAAMEAGFYDQVMTRGALDYQREVESGETVIVGVNKFQSDEKVPVKTFKVDPEVEARQVAKVKALKERRDNPAVQESLNRLRQVAATDENTMLHIVDAIKKYATIGEICDTLREVWGEWQGKATFY